uniref:Small ribosomal subunit protein uS19c n=2 Tax=Euglena gracilis TaxID=3039 RepID=RR19_EUGGR|nr:ribosomal protein S19 [Euglena gracilis]P19170.1 RecName: Full=Small ribosomal subunit protein uS19c; AltName: Full=30S ribosomal protein S19, chloroplastic [Euglena gracilis]AKL82368.1 ribosomal protein S19 [Euglena gracilis var. bacillaris]AAA84225.1 ribosomal protein [Euglena gracilis]CAA50101.1 30S ribosomal protein S19 [Euglena gracilis]CAA77918.1 ribosomal protein S19 [Euglena gracilis]
MSRSLKKGPFVFYSLIKKVDQMNSNRFKSVILTWSRSCTIIPIMIGNTIGVYNGKEHIPVLVSDQMIGHKLGEFVQTRNYRGHKKHDKKTKTKR